MKLQDGSLSELHPHNAKQFWKATQYLHRPISSIPILFHNNAATSTDKEKANMLNYRYFFLKCFNNHNLLWKSLIHCLDYNYMFLQLDLTMFSVQRQTLDVRMPMTLVLFQPGCQERLLCTSWTVTIYLSRNNIPSSWKKSALFLFQHVVRCQTESNIQAHILHCWQMESNMQLFRPISFKLLKKVHCRTCLQSSM